MNERKTEDIVSRLLMQAGYENDPDIVVEKQASDYPIIDKLLKNASKKGTGKGFPEFIIRSTRNANFVIVIECKADVRKHESITQTEYADFAVDGVLLYASFLSRSFDVLAIAVSGENLANIKISQFVVPKDSAKPYKYFGDKILSYSDYYSGYNSSDIKFNQDYSKLLEYTKELNDKLHSKKIKESQRSLLISGILIALSNSAFKNSYRDHETAEQIGTNLLSTTTYQFNKAKLPEAKIKKLRQAFSFIETHTTLSNDVEFFRGLIDSIDKNVNTFMKTYTYFDTLGQFYIEFLRYANNDKGLGIVLTPPHITDLFCEIADVTKDSVVFDNCCGTGGFLISAMKRMITDSNGDVAKIGDIKSKQIVGIEYQDDIYALSVSNMIIHGDGKSNIKSGDCFNLTQEISTTYSPTIGLLNPPYKTQADDKEELQFVLNNLSAIGKGGKCIALVPLSCAISTSGTVLELKQRIMSNHTIDAVMSLPEELFHNSKVNVVTCAIVITAHKPHPQGLKTWLGYWREDGFIKTKGQGRIDLENTWPDVKKKWIDAYRNREIVANLSTTRVITAEDEWCAEAYMNTDYSVITEASYMTYLKKYMSFRLMNDLVEMDNHIPQKPSSYRVNSVKLSELFNVVNGLASSQVNVTDEQCHVNDVRYIRPSQTYIGSIAGFVNQLEIDDKHIFPDGTIYVSTDGQGSHTYSYVSSFNFVPNSNVSVLIPKRKMELQEKLYYAMCVTCNRYKYSYGRKPKGDRLKEVLLPEYPPEFIYSNVFEKILMTWKTMIDAHS